LNEYYFIKAEPLIDDGDFDRLEKLIQPTILFDAKQDKSVPLLQGVEKIDAMEDIPLLKDEEKQAKHSIEMLSLDKFLEPKDVEDFVKRLNRYLNKNQDYIYSVEPKIDGNSISLIYENGILTKALSRGDGKVGEVLTLAIFEIPSIPKILKIDDVYAKDLYIPKILEVRGEIFMGNKDFLALKDH
jgi:DNA ligase (NAD+)